MTSSGDGRVLAGLIGSHIQASLTPALHMREGSEQGLQYRYDLFDLDRIAGGPLALTSLVNAAQHQGFAGLNITHPCKQTVPPLLDELSVDARALGAVNTVVFVDGRKVGHNTDWWGFAESFRRGLQDVPLNNVVQLGAGGAGAAVGTRCSSWEPPHSDILDIDRARMNALVAHWRDCFRRSA